MKRWQYEIIGCLPFYLIAIVGLLMYVYQDTSWVVLVPAILLLMIGVWSLIKVYFDGDDYR